MFSIFKKKSVPKIDLSAIGTDMHSHLLPGIDDGSPDEAVSLTLIRGLQQLGYRQFITTPHIMWDVHKNNPTIINGAKERLEKAIRQDAIDVPLRAAAEYYLDDHFDGLLSQGIPLLTIKDNWVLVEFSFVAPPRNLKDMLFEMQIKGYKPILAHPERYNYIISQKNLYDELKELGCYFQLNLLSLTGYYGKVTSELANYLIKKKYIDLLGTDLHHERHLEALSTSPHLMNGVKAVFDSGNILNSSL
ncbi:CpsB/CapC family capsule biosynthesis tyrosine phosphatase [Paraflavitalea sp. CAU 1676]|uniref:tyrosine-protein phosphatase n=1 Tax=Paraflavitalea sp. CAU 1676 TaxID=3032598 RepID=UPI0023D9DB13|nr:CpsB/CapC family capsule biosynthesis tyrosine phosphatase [Paraflavitalea sp. CAU 1676]MDF2187082.1 histidinol phosphatase [Paraflavitalea sp. CAU 1676]